MMKRTISAYEAPALVDAHGGLTRLALYERLSGKPESPPEAGLSAAIADHVVGFAAKVNRWANPVRRDGRFAASQDGSIDGYARYWTTSDEDGEFAVFFVHVAAYLFSSRWRRAGMPPEDYAIQAQWTLMASGLGRMAVVALADRTPEIFWIEADADMQARLRAGTEDMVRRIADKDPPPVDAEADAKAKPAKDESSTVVPIEKAHADWRAARTDRASARNRVQFADQAYEAAERALLAALGPGESHEHEGFRVTRNAKNDRLTEEKIDGLYF